MSKAPAMPMMIDAYIGDTTHLTTEEHGAYLLLLFAMWRRDGSVPDNDKDIARIVGLTVAKNLLQRLSSHSIKRKIDKLDLSIKIWFQPACAEQVRDLERDLIRRFNPPWNLIGKKIGVEAT